MDREEIVPPSTQSDDDSRALRSRRQYIALRPRRSDTIQTEYPERKSGCWRSECQSESNVANQPQSTQRMLRPRTLQWDRKCCTVLHSNGKRNGGPQQPVKVLQWQTQGGEKRTIRRPVHPGMPIAWRGQIAL